MPEKHKERYRVGALLRRSFKVWLDTYDVQFSEYRGLLDSVFVVKATARQHKIIHDEIARINNA